jgi:hypothetical protein
LKVSLGGVAGIEDDRESQVGDREKAKYRKTAILVQFELDLPITQRLSFSATICKLHPVS